MPDNYRYATYPSAKVYDGEGKEIHHLLWGDWVNVKGDAVEGKVPVHVRGCDGFMFETDLQEERVLELVFVDVGQGDGCLMVTPEDKKLIIDAGQEDNMYRYLKWRFHFQGGPRKFDAAVITHPDQDHYKGFWELFKEPNVQFEKIYHNGIMEQKGQSYKQLCGYTWIDNTKYITELMETQQDLKAFLDQPERYGTKYYANMLKDALDRMPAGGNHIRMLAASEDPDARVYMEGFEEDKPLSIQVLGPVPESPDGGCPMLRWFRGYKDKPDKGKTKNGHSVLLKIVYKDVSILLGGDLNSKAEGYLMQHYTRLPWPPEDLNREKIAIGAARKVFGVDILKSCHHGSADFTDTFLEAVKPTATVISSGDEESYAHPRCDTLGAIGLHGRGWRPLIFSTELSRSTREDEGNKHIELGKKIQEIHGTGDPDKKAKLEEERDRLIEELGKRNVTVYGAINVRSDGHRVVFAYMLEKERKFGGRLTKWDIYQLEPAGGGPLVYVD